MKIKQDTKWKFLDNIKSQGGTPNSENVGRKWLKSALFIAFLVFLSLSVIVVTKAQLSLNENTNVRCMTDNKITKLGINESGCIIDDAKKLVFWNKDGIGEINCTPHTASGLMIQEQICSIRSDLSDQIMKVAFKIDSDEIIPFFSELVNETKQKDVFGMVNKSYECKDVLNISGNYAKCIKQEINGTTILFEHDFKTKKGNIIYWSENGVIGKKEVEKYIWERRIAFKMKEESNYYVLFLNWKQSEIKKFKIEYNTLPNSGGKFEIMLWKAIDTIQKSLKNGNFVLLDPWWNASWKNKYIINISNSNLTESIKINTTLTININHVQWLADDKSALESGDDIRIVCNNIEISRLNETGAWNSTNINLSFRIDKEILPNSYEDDYCFLYSNNSDAGIPPRNPDNVYLMYADFEDNTLNGYYHTGSRGVVSSTNAFSYEGNYALSHNHTATSGGLKDYFSKGINPNATEIEFSFFVNETTDTYLFVKFCNINNNQTKNYGCDLSAMGGISFYDSAFRVFDIGGSWIACGTNFLWNTWYKMNIKNIDYDAGTYQIYRNNTFSCEGTIQNNTKSVALLLFEPDNNRQPRKFIYDYTISSIRPPNGVTMTITEFIISVPPTIPSLNITPSIVFCANDNTLYERVYEKKTIDGIENVTVQEYYTTCQNGCENSTFLNLGNAGCKESDMILALILLLVIFSGILIIRVSI